MMRRHNNPVPQYCDGYFYVYDIVSNPTESNPDFPNFGIQQRNLDPIWYRDVSVYDKTRLTFEAQDIEVTHKIRIPEWDGISTDSVCMISGEQRKVYNKANVFSADGFPETELTLIKPSSDYEVITNGDDD